MQCKPKGATPPVNEQPVYWFCLMDMAVQHGDLERALRAKRELERLGIRVTYSRPLRPENGGGHAA